MAESCRYFEESDWDQRLEHHVDRIWDVTDLLDRLDGVDDREAVVTRLCERTGLDRDELLDQPLSDQLEGGMRGEATVIDGDVDMEQAVAVWLETRSFDPPTECPHPPGEDGLCLFHRPVEEKDDEGVRDAFLECFEAGAELQFVGARFGNLDLDRLTVAAPTNHAIDLRFADVHGRLGLERATVDQDLRLYGAEITAPECRGATFHGEVVCMDAAFGRATRFEAAEVLSGSQYEFSDYFAEFAGEITFADAEFQDRADFKRVVFDGDVSFNTATFEAVAVYSYATFAEQADFMHVEFDRKADFSKATFGDYAIFYATFHDKAVFNYCQFRGEADFWSADFHGIVDVWVAEFRDEADFRHADFRDYATFRETTFEDRAEFTGATFHDDLRFDRLESGTHPIDLTDAELSGGDITQRAPGTCLFDMAEATLGDVEISGPDPGALFTDFRFLETNFDGFDFASHREALSTDWEIHTFAGDDDQQHSSAVLESTYLRAKNGANEGGDSKAASEFFLTEMKYRRRRYADESALGREVVNWFYYLTCGYGERPLRSVLFSLGVIGAFAGLYGLLGLNLAAESNPAAYLVFSFQSFVTLILGGVPGSQSTVVRLAAAFEAFVGAFFIALFVFALTRTIHR